MDLASLAAIAAQVCGPHAGDLCDGSSHAGDVSDEAIARTTPHDLSPRVTLLTFRHRIHDDPPSCIFIPAQSSDEGEEVGGGAAHSSDEEDDEAEDPQDRPRCEWSSLHYSTG